LLAALNKRNESWRMAKVIATPAEAHRQCSECLFWNPKTWANVTATPQHSGMPVPNCLGINWCGEFKRKVLPFGER
jgi:hypothetical protein